MRDRERFSPAQCRAGRGLLGWSIDELARRARLEPEGVELYEAGEGQLGDGDLAATGEAFALAGVIAIPQRLAGEGVRFSAPRTPFASTDDAFDLLAFPARSRLVEAIAADLADAAAFPEPRQLRSPHAR
jgi:hypothetical protein